MKLVKRVLSFVLALALVVTSMYMGKRVLAESSYKDNLSLKWKDTTENTLYLCKSDIVSARLALTYSRDSIAKEGDINIKLPEKLFTENNISLSISGSQDDPSGFSYFLSEGSLVISNYKEIEKDYELNVDITYTASNPNEFSIDTPSVQAVCGNTKSETLGIDLEPVSTSTYNASNASGISLQSDSCPASIKLFSMPSSPGEDSPKVVNAGDLIEYYALVTNVSEDDDINNVEVKFHIDDALTTDLSTACYNLTKVPTAKNKKPIAGSSDYSARLEGNDVVFKANRIDWDSYVMFHITCTTAVEGKVSSRASVKSVGGTAYTGVESSAVYHEVRQEVSEFTLRTGVDGNNQYADGDRVFTYNFNLTKSGNGLNTSIPYDLMSGSSSVSKGTLTLENGIGTVSFPAKYTFKTEKMPTGVSYIVTHKADNNYTWNKDSLTGTTDLGGSSLSFTAVYKYVPVKYSLDTGIVVNMQGREFKPGDSFTYSVAPVNVGDPIFNRFPLPYGDGDTIAYFEESARIKPTSGSTATLPLQERLGRIGAIVTNGCNSVYRTSAEENFYEGAKDCWCGYSVQPRDMNISHEMCFLYPGTYDYIVFQTAMYTDDAESIQQDTTQYKVTVTVTASGSNLTPSLTSVKKSTDGGETWKAISDKSKLTFTNTYKGASEFKDFTGNISMDNGNIDDYLGNFEFVIEPIGAGPKGSSDLSEFSMPSYMPIPEDDIAYNDAGGNFTFSNMEFIEGSIPAEGVRYAYKVYMKQPTTTGKLPSPFTKTELDKIKFDGVTTKNVGESTHLVYNGVMYDPKVTTVYVEAIVSNGKILVAFPTPQFNISLISRGTLESSRLPVSKTINGRDWQSQDVFTYLLSGADNTTRNAIEAGDIVLKKDRVTLSNLQKSSNFGNIEFEKAGIYMFKAVESDYTIPGLTTAERTKTIQVNVTDSGDGTLNAQIMSGDFNFISNYQVTSATLEDAISTSIKINGRDWDNRDNYKVTIVGADSETEEAINNGLVTLTGNELYFSGSEVSGNTYTQSVEPITFSSSGTYNFKAVFEDLANRQGQSLQGDNEVPFSVTVTDSNGALVASVDKSTILYTLNYSATGTLNANEYSFSIDISGRDWSDTDSFRFLIEGGDEKTKQEISLHNIELDTYNITANSKGIYQFSNIVFKKTGSYSFKIKQLGVDSNGLRIDNAVRTIDVTVTDVNHNGTYNISKAIQGNLEFVNEYSAKTVIEGEDIPVRVKQVDSSNSVIALDGEVYSYTMEAADSSTRTALTNRDIVLSNNSVSIDKNSNSYDDYKEGYFGGITVNKAGTYSFKVTQETESKDGFNYDTVKAFVITAVDNGIGSFDIEISGDLSFVNRYSSSGILNGVYAISQISGRSWKDDDSFSYSLEGNNDTTLSAIESGAIVLPEDSDIEITKSSSSKQANFGFITFNKAGTYSFKITQVSNCGSNIIEDEEPVRVFNVRVTEAGGGNLSATSEDLTQENLTFVNRYESFGHFDGVSAKVLIDGREYNGDRFTVDVEQTSTSTGVERLTTSCELSSTLPNLVGGFDVTKPGTYSFKLTQRSGSTEGLIYDDKEYTYTVTAVDDLNGNLICTPSTTDEFVFINLFTTSTAYSGLEIEKVIEGRSWHDDDRFNFTLAADDEVTSQAVNEGNVVLPKNLTITNANHKGTFGNIVFKKAGTYKFYVREIAGSAPGLTYDSRKRPLEIEVTKDNTTGNLTASVVTTEFNSVFKSTYTAMGILNGTTNLRFKVTGETGTRILIESESDYGSKVVMPPVCELSVSDNDIMSFGNIQFNAEGKYKFTIRQLEGTNSYVSYDTTPHTFTVTVTEGENAIYNVESDLNEVVTFVNSIYSTDLLVRLNAHEEDGTQLPDETFNVNVTMQNELGTALDGSYPVVNKLGETIATIRSGESITMQSGNEYRINLPSGTRYSVSVGDKEDFEYSTTNSSGVLSGNTVSVIVDCTKKVNTPVIKYGSLTLTSRVDGDNDLGVTYLVKLSSNETFNYSGSKEGTITNGGTVSLKNNESITISNIPEGTEYEISTRAGDYESTSRNAKGTIKANSSVFVEFSTIIPTEDKFGTLKVVGTVNDYNPVYGSVATIKVTLSKDGKELTESLSYTGEGNGTITGSKTFDMNNGAFALLVNNVPKDVEYAVIIEPKDFDGGYIGRKSTSNCKNVVIGGMESSASFELTAVANEVVEQYNDLGVRASFTDYTTPIKWVLHLTDRDNNPLEGTYRMTGTTEMDVTNGSEITFRNGMNCIIHDLPVGTKWNLDAQELEGASVSIKAASGQLGNISVPVIEVTVTGQKPSVPEHSHAVEVSISKYSKPVVATVRIEKDGSPVNTVFNCDSNSSVNTVKNGDKVTVTDGFRATFVTTDSSDWNFSLVIPESEDYTISYSGRSGTDTSGNSLMVHGYSIEGKECKPVVEYSNLVITSSLADGDNREATINLKTADGKTLDGEYNYLTGSGSSGKLSNGSKITLTGKDSVTVSGLPVGSKYTVSVPEKSGYVTDKSNTEGTITKSTPNVIISSVKEKPEVETGNVKILIEDTTELAVGYTVKIGLTNPDGSVITGSYPATLMYNNGSAGRNLEVTGSSTQNFPKDFDWFEIKNVPVGTTITVIPTEDTQLGWRVSGDTKVKKEGSNVTLTAYKKQVVVPEKHANLRLNVDINTYTGTVPITISLKDSNGRDLTEGYNYTGTKSGKLYSNGKITFDGSGSVVIKNLPVGTKVKVSIPDGKYTYNFDKPIDTIVEAGNSINLIVDGFVVEEDYANITVRPEFKNYNKPVPVVIKLMDTEGNELKNSYNYTCGTETGKITGSKQLTLSKGNEIVIKDVPVHSKYSVTVASSAEYTSQVMGDSTVILGTGSLTKVVITGKTIDPPIAVNNFVVMVDPGTYKDGVEARVTLIDSKGVELKGSYIYSGIVSGSLTSGNTIRFSEKGGITIKSLPVGTMVKLDIPSNPKYSYVVTGDSVVNDKEVSILNIKFTEVEAVTADVTYTFNVSDKLGETAKGTIIINTNSKDGLPLDGEYEFVSDTLGTGVLKSGSTFEVRNGDTLTIKGLPVGCYCTGTLESADSTRETIMEIQGDGTLNENDLNITFTLKEKTTEDQPVINKPTEIKPNSGSTENGGLPTSVTGEESGSNNVGKLVQTGDKNVVGLLLTLSLLVLILAYIRKWRSCRV